MEQTVSKTFGMTLRIEVDPENEDLLAKYFDGMFQRGTMHKTIARFGGAPGDRAYYRKVMLRDNSYVEGLTIDHINGIPSDHRRENLQMVTHTENMRRRDKTKAILYAIPPIPRVGLRLYPIEFTVTFDETNADLLHMMELAYERGNMYRASASLIASIALGQKIDGKSSAGLTRHILHRKGITVPKGLTVDHINGDGGLNTYENLRVVTRAVNNANRKFFTYPAAMTA